MNNKIVVLLIIFLYSLGCNTQIEEKIVKESIMEDIIFLKKELPKRHINLFENISEEEYNLLFSNVIDSLKYNPKETNYYKVCEIVCKTKDSHTGFSFSAEEKFPMDFKMFQGKVYITSIIAKYAKYAGAEVITINNYPLETIFQKIEKIVYLENKSALKNIFHRFLTRPDFYNYARISNQNSITLKVKTENNTVENLQIKAIPTSELENINLKKIVPTKIPYYKKKKDWFWYEIIDNTKLYIRYAKCSSREHLQKHKEFFGVSNEEIDKAPSIKEFSNNLLKEIKNNNHVDTLIFDIRDNTGGNSIQGTDLIYALSTLKKFNTKDNFFVLINYKNYSSATINIMDFTKYTHATLIGETPRGTPNHYGELNYFTLPNSQLRVYYSTKYFQRIPSPNKENIILPDVEITPSFEEYKEGKDPVLQYILNP